MTRLLAACAFTIAVTFGSIGVIRRASAATPTPAATATPVATPTTTPEPMYVQLNYTIDPLVLYWEPTAGATTYHIFGSVSAVEANAVDPFCTAAVVEQTRQIDIDAELPAGTGSFVVNTPPLPTADKWFMPVIQLTIVALDGARATIATGGLTAVAEARCGGPVSPPEASILTEDTIVGGCPIPAGYIEVTTQSAIDHGQRVFADAATRADRWYVRFRTGGCVHLTASADMPFPDFIADDHPLSPPGHPLSPPSIVTGDSPSVAGAVRAPDTGTGPGERRHIINEASMLVVAASAIVFLGGGLATSRIRRR